MNDSCCGVILAGGLARRMGGVPKHQLTLAGKPLLEHVIERARPQVDQLLLNVNPPIPSDIANHPLNLPIIEDSLAGHLGPLAGILSALQWMQQNSDHQWLVSFAVDTPLFPKNLVASLQHAALRENKGISPPPNQLVCPTYNGYKQPTFCLWHINQSDGLKDWLVREKNYRMGAWLKHQHASYCNFSPEANNNEEIDPFANINTPEDLAQLEQLLTTDPS
jgi:molybdenum cofactor guanylyltransferase